MLRPLPVIYLTFCAALLPLIGCDRGATAAAPVEPIGAWIEEHKPFNPRFVIEPKTSNLRRLTVAEDHRFEIVLVDPNSMEPVEPEYVIRGAWERENRLIRFTIESNGFPANLVDLALAESDGTRMIREPNDRMARRLIAIDAGGELTQFRPEPPPTSPPAAPSP